MCSGTRSTDLYTQGPVAAAFHNGVAGFPDDGEVTPHPLWMSSTQQPEPVLGALDLFVVIENPGHIDRRVCEL